MSKIDESETSARNDYDSPWKEILEAYFEECIIFFFPDVHAEIDWTRGYEFLDKELQQVAREAETGKRIADKLVKVWSNQGEQVWILIHIEVQSQYEAGFAQRMYIYNARLQDLFNRPVASFAILSDASPNWRPHEHNLEQWGTRLSFEFRIAKLLDYADQWENLLASENPFSMVVMSHLKALETSKVQSSRKEWKLRLIKLLYERGYQRQDVIQLLRFIDWLLALPVDLEAELWQDILTYQEEMNMPYVTSLERLAADKGREEGREEGHEEGLAEGLRRGIKVALRLKFGELGLALMPKVESIKNNKMLTRLEEGLEGDLSLEELQQILAEGDTDQ